jgi:hypothetical protein
MAIKASTAPATIPPIAPPDSPPPVFDGAGVSVACAVSRGTDVEDEDVDEDDVVVDGGAVVDDSDVSLVALD